MANAQVSCNVCHFFSKLLLSLFALDMRSMHAGFPGELFHCTDANVQPPTASSDLIFSAGSGQLELSIPNQPISTSLVADAFVAAQAAHYGVVLAPTSIVPLVQQA